MDDDEDDFDVAAVAKLGSQVLKALDAENILVTLQNGKIVEGSLASFSLRKRERKGNVSWNGKLSVEIDTGVLDIDIANIESVKTR